MVLTQACAPSLFHTQSTLSLNDNQLLLYISKVLYMYMIISNIKLFQSMQSVHSISHCFISSQDLFLGKFSLIFIRNFKVVQLFKFLLLYCFNLSLLILNLLSDFSAFLKIIKSILFTLFIVGLNLRSELLSVLLKYLLLLFFNSSFLFLNLFLLSNDSHELISFLFSLLS